MTTSCWTCILRHISTRYTVKSETELWCRYPSILMFRLLSASWFHFCQQFWTLPCRALCKKPWYGDRISSPLILTCSHFENVLWKLLYETRKITNRLISFLGGNSRFAESPDSVKRKSRYVCLAEALIILKGWKSCSDWFQSQQYYVMCGRIGRGAWSGCSLLSAAYTPTIRTPQCGNICVSRTKGSTRTKLVWSLTSISALPTVKTV